MPKPVNVGARNLKIGKLLKLLIVTAAKNNKPPVFAAPFDAKDVEAIIANKIWGHRETVLIVILARLVDPSYKATVDLYACKPRAIFEGPMRTLLRAAGIPTGMSGILNVAKNVQKIDRNWAAKKRGGIGLHVLTVVQKIDAASTVQLQRFAVAYTQRYLQEAQRVKALEVRPSTNIDRERLSHLCSDMINSVADGGATPQKIVGSLLLVTNEESASRVRVEGVDDSVSATNTTSKKPGDLTEVMPDGHLKIYEVTVKKFSLDRIEESHDSISDAGVLKNTDSVAVICRREDVPEEVSANNNAAVLLGSLVRGTVEYDFFEIHEWVRMRLYALSPAGRKRFLFLLTQYVNDPNTSESVKSFYGEWQKQN